MRVSPACLQPSPTKALPQKLLATVKSQLLGHGDSSLLSLQKGQSEPAGAASLETTQGRDYLG